MQWWYTMRSLNNVMTQDSPLRAAAKERVLADADVFSIVEKLLQDNCGTVDKGHNGNIAKILRQIIESRELRRQCSEVEDAREVFDFQMLCTKPEVLIFMEELVHIAALDDTDLKANTGVQIQFQRTQEMNRSRQTWKQWYADSRQKFLPTLDNLNRLRSNVLTFAHANDIIGSGGYREFLDTVPIPFTFYSKLISGCAFEGLKEVGECVI